MDTKDLIKVEHKDLYDHLDQGYNEILVDDLADRYQEALASRPGNFQHALGQLPFLTAHDTSVSAIEAEWVQRHLDNTERLLNKAGYTMSDRCREAEWIALNEIAADQLSA